MSKDQKTPPSGALVANIEGLLGRDGKSRAGVDQEPSAELRKAIEKMQKCVQATDQAPQSKSKEVRQLAANKCGPRKGPGLDKE